MILFNSQIPEFAWLSNFWPAPVVGTDGRIWPTTEHAYQGLKSLNFLEQEKIRKAKSAKQAKFLARDLQHPRPNWDKLKLKVMILITDGKYKQHPDLKAKLLATGQEELVHHAPWGDLFWGVCKGQGLNWQGKILVNLRTDLQYEQQL